MTVPFIFTPVHCIIFLKLKSKVGHFKMTQLIFKSFLRETQEGVLIFKLAYHDHTQWRNFS